jgi:DNA-binding XRE family transcriptional regulator
MTIQNNLAHLRQRQGLSARRLAELVDVQRQTIYAMEAGTYVPNTLIALRLAHSVGAACFKRRPLRLVGTKTNS